jgi:hypothetical protein
VKALRAELPQRTQRGQFKAAPQRRAKFNGETAFPLKAVIFTKDTEEGWDPEVNSGSLKIGKSSSRKDTKTQRKPRISESQRSLGPELINTYGY